MDNYSEQLVSKKRGKGDIVKLTAISAGTIILATIFMFLAIVSMIYSFVIPAVIILFVGIWLMGNQNIEYEYIITNGEMDIDKIIGKRKRKRMITLDLKSAEDFAPYPPEEDKSADTTVHASNGLEQDAYYLIVNHSGYGLVKLIFNPNEKTREAITQELPNALRVKMRQNAK